MFRMALALLFVFALIALPAAAQDPQYGSTDGNDHVAGWKEGPPGGGGEVPEVDPAAMAGALTLLFGGLALVEGRRRRSDS